MPLYEIDNKMPVIGEGTWIAPSAEIIGDVEIGKDCYIGFGAIIRGDFGKIVIGDGTLVEENVVIHSGSTVEIGNQVIIGHMVMIHDAVIKDRALIGMMSMLCNGSTIGEWAILAEQSLVKTNQTIPPNKIYAGSPAREIGDTKERHRSNLIEGQQAYTEKIRQYHQTFKRIDESGAGQPREHKMTSGRKIIIEADLGRKGVEKTDVYVYKNTKLIETYFDKSFEDIRKIAEDMKARHRDTEVEITCTGEDCMGGFHRWSIDT